MISAAVGFKCPECASANKTHIEVITLKQYLTGGLAGIIVGAGTGFIWYYLSRYGVLISLISAYAVGFCISKAISASIGSKIGLKIKIFAGIITFISMVFNPIMVLIYMLQGAGFFDVLLAFSFALIAYLSSILIKFLALVIAIWAAIRHFRM